MEKQTNNTNEEALQAWMACYGGEQQLVEKLVAMDKDASDAVTAEQTSRLLSHLHKLEPDTPLMQSTRPQVTEVRPQVLECDVVRFQNNREKWVALVGLLDGYPYEIFTGLQDDEEGIMLPKSVSKGKIIKQVAADGSKRYDFQFENTRGYKITVEGLSEKFNPEYWNYAKLISGVLRYRMPIEHVIRLVASLQLKDESLIPLKNGGERALTKHLPGQADKADTGATADTAGTTDL